MAPWVKGIASSITLGRLEAIWTKYKVPKSMAMVISEPHERACSPLDGFITVYESPPQGRALVSCPTKALSHHEVTQVLEVAMVKAMLCFTHHLDWIVATPRPNFTVMSGGNSDSTKRALAVAAATKKRKKKLRKKEASLGIEESSERPRKSHQTVASKCPTTIVIYSSSDDEDIDTAPLSSEAAGPPILILTAQPPADEPIPDVPFEFTESRGVEPPIDMSIELPCLAIQLFSPMIIPSVGHEEPLAEKGTGTPCLAEAQIRAEDHTEAVEPLVLDVAAFAPKVRVEIFVVQEDATEMPKEPEVPRGESSSGSSAVSKTWPVTLAQLSARPPKFMLSWRLSGLRRDVPKA
ncbi:hypothetical protein Nepgr_011097 [Nepenthes gracilis]|uniref:Uncharacterized protein n=1 Tax=Nepenthes gracilis TaxID=150966 RepID=A0AAD3XM25_NEPGR|nr:hypothetical protein Nepgr_011097 [Nepenthes gracilis]